MSIFLFYRIFHAFITPSTEECLQQYRTNVIFVCTPQTSMLIISIIIIVMFLDKLSLRHEQTSFICALKAAYVFAVFLTYCIDCFRNNSKINAKVVKTFFLFLLMIFLTSESPAVPTTSEVSSSFSAYRCRSQRATVQCRIVCRAINFCLAGDHRWPSRHPLMTMREPPLQTTSRQPKHHHSFMSE